MALFLPSSMAVSRSAPAVFAQSNSTSLAPACYCSKIMNRRTNKDDKQLGFAGISNGSRLKCMQVVNPFENKRFETLSYVPALSSEQIAKQIDYIVGKGWIPCLEFDKRGSVFRENSRACGYYDGRYWTMWKLPMFGCRDAAAVLREVEECRAAYPDAFIRMMAYDNRRQVQCVAFLVHRPAAAPGA